MTAITQIATGQCTPIWNPGCGNVVYNPHPIGVWWNGARWAVYNQDLAAMPEGRLALFELSRKAGFILRQPDSATIGSLFTRLEEYDEQERAHTFDFLKLAINETRSSLEAEPAYDDQ